MKVDSSRYALATGLFAGAAIAQYLGAALAVGIFGQMPAPVVAWWRIAFAALVLVLWRRPWRSLRVGSTSPLRRWWKGAALFGVVLALMNIFFYVAISHIPLGSAVSIEFVGPIAVAAFGSRGLPQRIAVVLAGLGVITIGGLAFDLTTQGALIGLGAALLAGALWAAYVVIGARLAGRARGIDILAVGMFVGALVTSPVGYYTPGNVVGDSGVMGRLLLVALLSSVIPYVVDQLNFGILPPATFAILLATMPATSVIVGAIALSQIPSAAEIAGLLMVSVAVWLANMPASPRTPAGELPRETQAPQN